MYRSLAPTTKLGESNGLMLPVSFPNLSFLPPAISSHYNRTSRLPIAPTSLAESESIICNLLGKRKPPHPSDITALPINVSTIPSVTGEIDSNEDGRHSADTTHQKSTTTTLNGSLSFGMARLLGDAKSKAKSGT